MPYVRITCKALAALCMLAAAGAPAASVEDLAWLAGCWASVKGEHGSGETWTAPAGGTLLGLSRTVRSGRTVAHEFMQIREIEPGKLALVALPSNQPETTFPLLRASARELVFENAAHDFPQRVVYRWDGRDELLGRIEGTRNGKPVSADFPMRRAVCP